MIISICHVILSVWQIPQPVILRSDCYRDVRISLLVGKLPHANTLPSARLQRRLRLLGHQTMLMLCNFER